jgi:hypothetical protein
VVLDPIKWVYCTINVLDFFANTVSHSIIESTKKILIISISKKKPFLNMNMLKVSVDISPFIEIYDLIFFPQTVYQRQNLHRKGNSIKNMNDSKLKAFL